MALLQRSLERGRLGHAYLLTGGSLANLEATARNLAKTLECGAPPQQSTSGMPLDCCDQCAACRKIDADNHPDVHWVRPESKSRIIVIEQMVPRSGSSTRPLTDTIQMKPSEGVYKVGVIVEADRLGVEAANAFLKTLEEPPAKSVIVLLTTQPQQVLDTIMSRCLRLNLGHEPGLARDENRLRWLALFTEMAAKERAGLLERYRLLAAVLSELARLRKKIDENLTAQSPLGRYEDLDPGLAEQWERELAAAIEAEYRRQRSELVTSLEWWLRDVWLLSHGCAQGLLSFPEWAGHLKKVAERISEAAALENLKLIENTHRLLNTNVQEALALEVSLLKLRL